MRSNWSENITFGAAEFSSPKSVAELQKVVANNSKVRVVGAGHSFNDICDTPGCLVSLEHLNQVVEVNATAGTVTVEGGIRYHELAHKLEPLGLALQNLPSLPHFSVVGACSTGTHGSGDHNGCLATSIRRMKVVVADGDLVEFSGGDLTATAVSLGAFGIVAELTLDVVPDYQIAQEIHLDMPLENAIGRVDEIMASAYSVSYFTTWQADHVEQVWRKHLAASATTQPAGPEFYLGARPASERMTPSGVDQWEYCTEQFRIPGPWHDRLPHVRAATDVRRGGQLQTEYFVDRRYGPDALRTIAEVGPRLFPDVIRDGVMAEVRTVASDDLWLSPFPCDSLALHFSWITDVDAVDRVLPELESALEPFQPRPHWGKLHKIPVATLRERYPKLGDFEAKIRAHDPHGKFRNPYLDALFAGEGTG